MKVGTDGVLLGAWAHPTAQAANILDIGAGTGVISLMLAQRFQKTQITAIEIDPAAALQCDENFSNSPWKPRLNIIESDFLTWGAPHFNYDLLVSNPPFYKEKTQETNSRTIARQSYYLPSGAMLKKAAALLNEDGVFALILPYSQEQDFLKKAATVGLFPSKITHVRGHANSLTKRTLVALVKHKITTNYSELTLEIERHQFTETYKALVKDFYWNL